MSKGRGVGSIVGDIICVAIIGTVFKWICELIGAVAVKLGWNFDVLIADVRENLCTCVVASPCLDIPMIADISIDMCQKSICNGKIRSM